MLIRSREFIIDNKLNSFLPPSWKLSWLQQLILESGSSLNDHVFELVFHSNCMNQMFMRKSWMSLALWWGCVGRLALLGIVVIVPMADAQGGRVGPSPPYVLKSYSIPYIVLSIYNKLGVLAPSKFLKINLSPISFWIFMIN